MRIEKKLKRWVEAGIINEPTKLEIINFEKAGSGTNVMFGILAIGALAIVVGIISIIAANWYLIPKYIKLASNLTWLLGLTFGVWHFRNSESKMIRETLILILFGSILASMGLIGQIYHLESHTFKTLSLWLVLGTPIILFSKTKYAAYTWALIVTFWAFETLSYFFPVTNHVFDKPIYERYGLIPIFLFYLTILLKKLNLKNTFFMTASQQFGSILFVGICMILGSIRWRYPLIDPPFEIALVILVLALPVAIYLGVTHLKIAGILFFMAVGFLEIPHIFGHEDLKVTSGLYFLSLWGSLAYIGSVLNDKNIFDMSCLMIAIRVIVIYFEVFGTLLETGIGLVVSGCFILTITYLWYSKKDKIWSIGVKNE